MRGFASPPLGLPGSASHAASGARTRRMTFDTFVEWLGTGFLVLSVVAMFMLSAGMLTNVKIHYLTAGGNFYEKLHPATYFTFLAFFLLLMRSRGPIGELDRMFSQAKL